MNEELICIKVKDIIHLDIAVVAEEGKIINAEIRKHLSKEQCVTVDFEGIDLITTAFLNTAIGELYKDYKSEFLNKYLTILLQESDFNSLKLVIERAKDFYSDTASFNESAKKAFGDE